MTLLPTPLDDAAGHPEDDYAAVRAATCCRQGRRRRRLPEPYEHAALPLLCDHTALKPAKTMPS
jgi:hypothetical protein